MAHVSWAEGVCLPGSHHGLTGRPPVRNRPVPKPAAQQRPAHEEEYEGATPEPPINVMPLDPGSIEGRFIRQLVEQREELRARNGNTSCLGEFMQLLSRCQARANMKDALKKMRDGDDEKDDSGQDKSNLDGRKLSKLNDEMRAASALNNGTGAQEGVMNESEPKEHDSIVVKRTNNPEFGSHYYCQMFLLFCAVTFIAAVTIARILYVESKPYVREFPESVNVGEFNLPLATLTEGEILMHNYTYDNMVGAWIRTPKMTYGSFQVDARTPAVTGAKLVFAPDTPPTLGRIRFDEKGLTTDSYFLPWEPGQRQALPQSIVISMSTKNVEMVDLRGGAGTVGGMRITEATPAKLLGNSDVMRIGSRDVLDDVLSSGIIEDTDRPVFVALTGSHLYFGVCLDDECSTERLVDMKSVYSKDIQRVSLSLNPNMLPNIELFLSTGETKLVKCNHPICLDAAM